MRRIINFIKELITKRRVKQVHTRWLGIEDGFFKKKQVDALTSEEVAQIRSVWKGLPFSTKHLDSHHFYKDMHGFDPLYLAMPLYNPFIIRKLNPMMEARAIVNKGYFDVLFDELNQPQLYIKKIRDGYYDSESNLISKEQAMRILMSKESFVIKPSQDTYGGANIKLVRKKLSKNELTELIKNYKYDFVVQEILKQHEDTAKFNPESLNTIRIITLLVNGKVTILSAALRCGQHGAEVDNATSGGLMVKINDDGTLNDFAVDTRFKKIYKTHNDVEFKGQHISSFSKVKELVLQYHPKYYPSLGIVAWDFAIGKNSNVVFIEANTKVPGIFWMQLCSGPIFGERTQEVLDYINK